MPRVRRCKDCQAPVVGGRPRCHTCWGNDRHKRTQAKQMKLTPHRTFPLPPVNPPTAERIRKLAALLGENDLAAAEVELAKPISAKFAAVYERDLLTECQRKGLV